MGRRLRGETGEDGLFAMMSAVIHRVGKMITMTTHFGEKTSSQQTGRPKMTIQEAIKSGKNFRRPILDYLGWVFIKNKVLMRISPNGYIYNCKFLAEDILADDWEVREE